MALPPSLRRALHDPYELERTVAALTAHLRTLADAAQREHLAVVVPTAQQILGVRTARLRTLAKDIARELEGDDHQLAKVMAALWRGPALEHRAVAALCGGALGAADLKRLLRFFQKAEKRLDSWASVDALVSGAREHVVAHPQLFLNEARNRVSARQPLVRRFGVVLLYPLARDPAGPEPDAILDVLRRTARDPEPLVQKANAWVLRDLHRRAPDAVDAFLAQYADDPDARGTLAAYRAKTRTKTHDSDDD